MARGGVPTKVHLAPLPLGPGARTVFWAGHQWSVICHWAVKITERKGGEGGGEREDSIFKVHFLSVATSVTDLGNSRSPGDNFKDESSWVSGNHNNLDTKNQD